MSEKMIFVSDNINDMMVSDRKIILHMLYNSASRNKLKEKGGGTQIKLSDISDDLSNKIYDFVVTKLNEQTVEI